MLMKSTQEQEQVRLAIIGVGKFSGKWSDARQAGANMFISGTCLQSFEINNSSSQCRRVH